MRWCILECGRMLLKQAVILTCLRSPSAFCTVNTYSLFFLILLQPSMFFCNTHDSLTTCRPNLRSDGKSLWSLGRGLWSQWECWLPLQPVGTPETRVGGPRTAVTRAPSARVDCTPPWSPCHSPVQKPVNRVPTKLWFFWPFSPFHFFNFKNSEI